MNKLAIIGANAAITCLIKKAKEKGYETHVFAWKCGDPGEKEADYFYPISIAEKEQILEKCKQIGIDGVCSITSDFAVGTVNYVARNLGLPGNSEKTDLVARNKFEMRKAFQTVGLYVPKFAKVNSCIQGSDVANNMRFPLIVKPVDRWSSKGVTRVENELQLQDAVRYAINESISKYAIIEEFMEGPEYSAECIVYKGTPTVLAFTKKSTTGFPHYIETGHKQPANLSEFEKIKINKVVCKALEALDIKNSAAHVEFRLLENGEVGIIEIGARMGGDCIGTHLTSYSTGMDYIGMVIDVAVGKQPDFTVIQKPIPVAIKFIISSSDAEQLENIKSQHSKTLLDTGDMDQRFGREVVDSSTRHGWYVVMI